MQSKLILLTATGLLATVSLPAQNKPYFIFTNKQHMVILPYEQRNGHIFIKGKVNNSTDLDFLFDPGAQTQGVVLDTSVKHTFDSAFKDNVTLTLKTLELPHQTVRWSSLKSLELQNGHPLGGLLGYEFIHNFVVRIDPKNKKLILTDPAYFGGSTLKGKITLAGNSPDLSALLKQGKTVTVNYDRQYMVVSE